MAGLRRVSMFAFSMLCAIHAGCATSSASRGGMGANSSLTQTSLRSPTMSQAGDATAGRSAAHPMDVVWREGMEVQWSVQAPTAPANRSMTGKAIVGPDGNIELGPYGSVHVAGLTERQAKTAVLNHLTTYLPDAQVTLVPAVFTSRTNGSSSDHFPVNQTTWQTYQAPAEATETAPPESSPTSTPAPRLGQRLLGWFKGS
jgi:hypothetical protein